MSIVDVQGHVDLVWILIAAAMVMLMQAGFTALESGVTRAKNSINVATKNISDFIVSVLIFFLMGYALMFGQSAGGFFGTNGFSLEGLDAPNDYAMFVFQATFAGTAATIISGAVAERMKFGAYLFISAIVVSVVYPISGHWIWNADGWLAQAGFVDFAGSTVVHSLGAWVGLAGAIILGPRLGRFSEDGKVLPIHGHSLVLAVVGVMILWFGWFGFNGGSTLTADSSIAKILANTILSASAGGISCFAISMVSSRGKVRIEKLLNGVVAGLVAITAGCAVLNPQSAVWLGLFTGIAVFYFEDFLLHVCKVDDPVNVVAAHGLAGAIGTLALAFLAPVENLPLGNSVAQFWVQLQGVLAVLVWGLTCGFLLFGLMKVMGNLRVSSEGEMMGLNVHEHGATSDLLDTMKAMNKFVAAHKGEGVSDLTQRIQAEIGTEGGEIALTFNQVIDSFHDTIVMIKNGTHDLSDASETMIGTSSDIQTDALQQAAQVKQVNHAIKEMVKSIQHASASTGKTADITQVVVVEVSKVLAVMRDANRSVDDLAHKVSFSHEIMSDVYEQSQNISVVVDTINKIADKTNLLALNAAIEAARAGDAGRGFSVVADEVRGLSVMTTESTAQIANLVNNLQARSLEATRSMDNSKENASKAQRMTDKVEGSLLQVTNMVKEIESMSVEMFTTITSQSEHSKEIQNSIQSIQSMATYSEQRAGIASEISQRLSDLSDTLSSKVSGMHVDPSRIH